MGNDPVCHVCGDTRNMHEHHIVPRNAGGLHGPTVWLCANCHNAIHHCADLKVSVKTYNQRGDRKQTFPIQGRGRAAHLVQVIRRSARLMQTQKALERKPTRISLVLTGEENKHLTDLARHLGTSKTNAVRYLIQNARVVSTAKPS